MNIIVAILIILLFFLTINGVRIFRYISSGEYSMDKRLDTIFGNNDDKLSSNEN